MWRNSRSFSSKLRSSSSFPLPSTTTTSISTFYRHITVARPSLRALYPYSSSLFSLLSLSPSSSDPTRQVFSNSHGVRVFSSVADPSSLASASVVSRAREAVDLARHYGRCYWELSKARLRYFVPVQLVFLFVGSVWPCFHVLSLLEFEWNSISYYCFVIFCTIEIRSKGQH